MAEKGEDLLKYIAAKAAAFLDSPQEEGGKKRERHADKERWSSRWFGMMPFALSIWIRARHNKQRMKKFRKMKSLGFTERSSRTPRQD